MKISNFVTTLIPSGEYIYLNLTHMLYEPKYGLVLVIEFV